MATIQQRIRTARRAAAEAGISLRSRRQWFVDEPNPTGTSPAGAQNTEQQSQNAIPYARFQEVNEARKKAEDDLAKLRADTVAANEKALKEQGKYKELYEKTLADLEAEKLHKARADALGETISATNKKRIERIPEAMRSVIPADYPPEKLSAWLDANENLLTKVPAPPTDLGKTGDSGKPPVELTDLEKQYARQANMSDADYAKYKAMRGTAATPDKSNQ